MKLKLNQPNWLAVACCAAPMAALVYVTIADGRNLDPVKYSALVGLCALIVRSLVSSPNAAVKPPESTPGF